MIRFSLNISHDEATAEHMKLGSQYCPNYLIIASNLTHIQSFIDTFKSSLSRRNSRYALVFPESDSFSATTFLYDNTYFEKVLNLAVILMSMDVHNRSDHTAANIRHNKR